MSGEIQVKFPEHLVGLYRQTRVGLALFDALHELMEAGYLNKHQALIAVTQFDVSVRKAMNAVYRRSYSFFRFEAEVAAYRLRPRDCQVVLANVAVYKHVPSREYQEFAYEQHQDALATRKDLGLSYNQIRNYPRLKGTTFQQDFKNQ